jgi:hypothetical protein
VEYMPVAAWFIHSGIYASGGLVYTVEYMPVVAWFIHNGMSVAAWFIHSGIYVRGGLDYIVWNTASGGLVYTQWDV